MVLSGIRPSFPSLSRSAGQITHVLLTRSPLEHPHHKNDAGLSVRLACVKHAASVRPEPGSNSPKKQKNYRQKTKKSTKQKQTTNSKHQKTIQCPHPCSCSCTNNNSFHQMTHYRVLKQHHHPQPNTPRCKGRKQRPHKYTNPTTKPQTPTSQQQNLTVVDHSEDLITFIVIRESTRATPGLPSKPLVNHCSYCSESRTRTRIK